MLKIISIARIPTSHFLDKKKKPDALARRQGFVKEVLDPHDSFDHIVSKSTSDRRKVPVFEGVGSDDEDNMEIQEVEGETPTNTSLTAEATFKTTSIWERNLEGND